jgi:hypothetical protein
MSLSKAAELDSDLFSSPKQGHDCLCSLLEKREGSTFLDFDRDFPSAKFIGLFPNIGVRASVTDRVRITGLHVTASNQRTNTLRKLQLHAG